MEYRLFSDLRDILQLRRIWEEYLPDVEHLILIPHQELHWLPLDTLFPRRFTVTYLPNAHLGIKLQQAQKDAPNKTLLSVQEPENELIMKSKEGEMIYAQLESELVASLYHPSKSIPGEKADYKTVTNELRPKADYFHFTGHGYHNIDEPLNSALALAGEDLLTFKDIINLEDLSHYHLVCLSSCETGITSSHNLVDEYIGLVSGFLAVGVTYVISSLWTVNEVSSALLMIRFHQLLQQQQPLTPPAALKEAQDWLKTRTWSDLVEYYEDLASEIEQFRLKSILRFLIKQAKEKVNQPDPPYAHHYHWAGFIITGKTSP